MCLSKSPNKHNRLYVKAKPLGDDLSNLIEDEKIGPKTETKERGKMLINPDVVGADFVWEKDDTAKIWSFAPNTNGPNILVDVAKGVQFLNEIKDSMEAAF